MEYRHQYDEVVKHFAEGQLKEAGAIQKDLQLHNVNIASYYTNKYALWLDFRTIDDNRLHGSSRRLENTSKGIRLQITKEAGADSKLSCYLYIFQDAQINIGLMSSMAWAKRCFSGKSKNLNKLLVFEALYP